MPDIDDVRSTPTAPRAGLSRKGYKGLSDACLPDFVTTSGVSVRFLRYDLNSESGAWAGARCER
jgi:hypothetical protein